MESSTIAGLSLPATPPMHELRTPDGAANPDAIGRAFDGMFASMLIKQMRQSLDGGLFGSDPGDVLGGMFDHFIGEHLSTAGGIGVGDMIRRQLEMRNEGNEPL